MDIIDQIGSDKKIHLISNLMLHQAIDKSFEKAINDKSSWLITLDADLVIKPNFFSIFKKIAASLKANEIEAHALTIDRLFMNYRSAGNRLYRVKYLPLLRNILRKTKNNIRPEGTMLKEAVKLGFKIKPTNDVVALHDFFQHSRDLFRKGYLCSFKHISYSSSYLPTWRELSDEAADFSILLRGFSYGLLSGNKPIKDIRSNILQKQYDELSKEFYKYDNEIVIIDNVDNFIDEITAKNNFYFVKKNFIIKFKNFFKGYFFGK